MGEFDNIQVLDITMEELPEEARNGVLQARDGFQHMCLLAFSNNKSGKVFQKQPLPRTLLAHQTDSTVEEDLHKVSEMVHKAMADTMRNHQAAFLNTFRSIMVDTFGHAADKPFEQAFGPKQGPVLFNTPKPQGKTAENAEGSGAGQGVMAQPQKQQLPMTYGQLAFGTSGDVPPSAFKVSSAANRLQKNVYGEGYQEFADYSSLDAHPNPGYGNSAWTSLDGQAPGSRNPNIDLIMHRMADMMQNRFGLKPKGQSYAYKSHYLFSDHVW